MSEQILKRREQRRKLKDLPNQTQPGQMPLGDKEAEEQLRKKIDAVLGEYQTSTAPSGPGVVVGQQQPHQVVRPLSDEEVVTNFRQTTGE